MTPKEWINKSNAEQPLMNLQPPNTEKLSEAKIDSNDTKKYDSAVELKKAEKKKIAERDGNEFLETIAGKLANVNDAPLPQNEMQGIDESEWDD